MFLSPLVWQIWRNGIQAKNAAYPAIFLLWSALENATDKNRHLQNTVHVCCTDIYQIILTGPDLKTPFQCVVACIMTKLWLFHFRLNRIIICNSFWQAQNDLQCLRWGVKLKGHKNPLWEYLVQFLAPHLSWFHPGWGDAKNVTQTIADHWLVRGDQFFCVMPGWCKRDKILWSANQKIATHNTACKCISLITALHCGILLLLLCSN